METLTTQTWALLAVVGVLALLALAAWFFYRRKKSGQQQQRFGPEYGRVDDPLEATKVARDPAVPTSATPQTKRSTTAFMR